MKRQLTFKLVNSEQEAEHVLSEQPRHLRKGYTPYQTSDGSFNGYIAWYKY